MAGRLRAEGGADGRGICAGKKIHLYHCAHRGLPLGLMGGWYLYKYPFNSVINTDPFGLKSCSTKIVEAVNKLNDDPKYSYLSAYGFGYHTNKCNIFVSDVLKEANVKPTERVRK